MAINDQAARGPAADALASVPAKPTPVESWREFLTPRRIVVGLLLAVLTAIFLFPFLWLVVASLKIRSEVFNNEWIPDPIAWENYARVWGASQVPNWLLNSVLVGVLAAATVTVSSAMVAFGFAYFRFPGRDLLFGLVLASMMLPGAVTMVPNFLIWDALGWTNTLTPLWAGNLFASAFYVFMLRQFFLTLPRELFEAARVDGAGYFGMWRRIAIPLTMPALIVVFIFEFKASWTDLVKPLIFLRDSELFTLPRGLKALLDQFGMGGEMQWEVLMAASVIVTLPMLVIFIVGQRYFVEGIATTGSK
jgi:multiple sugar transport system permease protein